MHAPVDSLSTRGQDPPAGTSSTFVQPSHVAVASTVSRVQRPSSATSKTQVQSPPAATAPALGNLSKTQRKKLRLANSRAKPLTLKCRTCGLLNHLRRACPFPNPFPKGVKKPPPRGLEPPSSLTDVNVVAKWTNDAGRMFPHHANASNTSVKKNQCLAVEVCLKRRDEGALRRLRSAMGPGSFSRQHWLASTLPETLLLYLTEVQGEVGAERQRQFFTARFGCYCFFSQFSTVSYPFFFLTGHAAHGLLKQVLFFVFFCRC